jgi:uncharacterized OB-fold protein
VSALKANPHLVFVEGEAPGAPGLKASRCAKCGTIVLLEMPVCPGCGARCMDTICAGMRGELRTASQVFHSADGFEAPYFIGEISTREGPRLFAPIIAPADARLVHGMQLEFVLVERKDGMLAFAYRPVVESEHAGS